jgi:hypothetical protein
MIVVETTGVGSQQRVEVPCPSGKRIFGGGWAPSFIYGYRFIDVWSSHPYYNSLWNWVMTWEVTRAGSETINVYAICAYAD